MKVGETVICINVSQLVCKSLTLKEEYVVESICNTFDVPAIIIEDDLGDLEPYATERFRKIEPKKETNSAMASILKEYDEQKIHREVDIVEQPIKIEC